MRIRFDSRGDTLIEVLCATAILSLIAVSTLSVMNQGSSVVQRALETTQVREQVSAQAETLRFLNASYIASHRAGSNSLSDYPTNSAAYKWLVIRSKAHTSATLSGDFINNSNSNSCPTAFGSGAPWSNDFFVMNTRNSSIYPYDSATFRDAPTFAQVRYNTTTNAINNVDGVWIEAVTYRNNASLSSVERYLDFNIWACWNVPGQTMPAIVGTKVRLYDPQ